MPSDLDAIDAFRTPAGGRVAVRGFAGLHGVDGGLAELLEFVGLSDVLDPVPVPLRPVPRGAFPTGGAAAVLEGRMDGKAEVFEQGRVDERVNGADASGDDVEHVDGERRQLRLPARPAGRPRRRAIRLH